MSLTKSELSTLCRVTSTYHNKGGEWYDCLLLLVCEELRTLSAVDVMYFSFDVDVMFLSFDNDFRFARGMYSSAMFMLLQFH